MFQFLSSLFTMAAERPAGVDNELIEEATDRVIEATDRRLKALGSYRRQLRNPVEKAVVYVIDLIAELPEPVEISRRTYGSDPRLKAFFASFDHMQEKIGGAKAVEAYLEQTPDGDHSKLYGLLSMQWGEQNRLGMTLQDDRIQRDVQQTAVNFSNHNFVGLSVSSEEAVMNMQTRAFDFMLGIALERIVSSRTRYAELEQQQRLLNEKLKAMKAGNWGLEEMLRPETSGTKDLNSLETEIDAVERELAKVGARHEVLDKNLQIIKDTLDKPDKLLALRSIAFELDSMNIKKDTSTSAKVHRIELIEAYSGIGAARILLPGWFPVNELPGARASIADAMRYL